MATIHASNYIKYFPKQSKDKQSKQSKKKTLTSRTRMKLSSLYEKAKGQGLLLHI